MCTRNRNWARPRYAIAARLGKSSRSHPSESVFIRGQISGIFINSRPSRVLVTSRPSSEGWSTKAWDQAGAELRYRVRRHVRVNSEDGHLMFEGLSDQETVKRIAMQGREVWRGASSPPHRWGSEAMP